MSELEKIQRAVFDVIRQPLTTSERMRTRMPDGSSVEQIVNTIIRPNDRLTSFERLEIYNRVYWFRLLSTLADDFPGLRGVIGQRRFDKLLVAYLNECPSESFSLRDLGDRLESWLRLHPEFSPGREQLALDMVKLEWADIEAFDNAEYPSMTEEDLSNLGEDPLFHLQPHIRLIELEYAVDKLLLKIRHNQNQDTDIVSNATLEHDHQVPSKRFSIPKPRKTYVAVHRHDLIVYFKRLEPGAFALLRAIQNAKTLSGALEESVEYSESSIEQVAGQLGDWFANWSSLGWFYIPKP